MSLCLYSFIKWYDLAWPCNSPKFNLYHLQKTSTGFKMVVITPKSSMSLPLLTKFLPTKYLKNSIMVENRPQWLVSDSRTSQKLSGIHWKPCFQNSKCYSKLIAGICIYFTLEHSKSLQILFSLFSDSCISKIRVKFWDSEPYTGEL